jgi:hypothetical protein
MSPSSRIVPLRFSTVCAWITPVLFTALCRRLPADCAVSNIGHRRPDQAAVLSSVHWARSP